MAGKVELFGIQNRQIIANNSMEFTSLIAPKLMLTFDEEMKKQKDNPYLRCLLAVAVTACIIAAAVTIVSANWARQWDNASCPSTSKTWVFWHNMLCHGICAGVQVLVLLTAGCVVTGIRKTHSMTIGIWSGVILACFDTGWILAGQLGGGGVDRFLNSTGVLVVMGFGLPVLLAMAQFCGNNSALERTC